MANAQPIVSTSEYDDNYFPRSTEDDFQQQQTFIYPEQQKSKTTKTKSRKNKRSGKKKSNQFSY
jgi:hypothetical protein